MRQTGFSLISADYYVHVADSKLTDIKGTNYYLGSILSSRLIGLD